MEDLTAVIQRRYIEEFSSPWHALFPLQFSESKTKLSIHFHKRTFLFSRLDKVALVIKSSLEETNTTPASVVSTTGKVVVHLSQPRAKLRFQILKQQPAIDITVEEEFQKSKLFVKELFAIIVDKGCDATVHSTFVKMGAIQVNVSEEWFAGLIDFAAEAASRAGVKITQVQTRRSSIFFRVSIVALIHSRVLLETKSNRADYTLQQVTDLLKNSLNDLPEIKVYCTSLLTDFISILSDGSNQTLIMSVVTDIVTKHYLPVKVTQTGEEILVVVKQYRLF